MRKIVIITGPTAVGKTEYAMKTAEKFDGEIVSCDSMQIYKYMDIGSAKPSADERNRIRHHLVDDIDPKVSFSAASYEKMAKSCIEDIFSRGKLPIVTGGTGLYLNSLIYEMDFGKIPAQEKFRRKLEEMAEANGGAYLFELLRKKAPQAAERIHPNNVRKIIRALESAEFSEEGPEDFSKLKTKTKDYDIVMIGLTRNRAELYERINRRVDAMMREGLAEEVKNLIKMGLSEDDISMKGIGYKECIAYLKDEYDLERAVELIKRNTRHFAKRQMTWLRKYDEMKWFDLSKYCDSSENAFKDIEKHIKEALKVYCLKVQCMTENKTVKVHNKSDKPDNVVQKEHVIKQKCAELEKKLPSFMRGFFAYLRGNVLPRTRLAYLQDLKFFCQYLITQTGLTFAEEIKNIKLEDFNKIKAIDVNMFIDYCRQYEVETDKDVTVYENSNKSLARKKSSVSVLFKQMYRDELIEKNITDGFDPIKVPKPGEKEIKALQDDEVMIMLDAVSTGAGLTEKEHEFWEKTKKRDRAILVIFLTYGLRLSELQQLNVSSFNFSRGEFKIYRKRGKESVMPLNKSVQIVVDEYLNLERKSDDEIDEAHKDALFLSLQGRRMTERQIRELVKKYTSIGMKTSRNAGYSPHKLRATTATSLIGRGNSIYDVQALMDHEQITTTQLYAAHKMNVKRDLVRNMEWELERKENSKKNDEGE